MPRVFGIVPVYFVAAGLTAFATNWLAAMKWRKAAAAHWAERARLLWPVRKGAAANVILLPACFGGVQFALDGGFSPWCVVAGAAAWLGAILGNYPLSREILPSMTFRQWLRDVIIAWAARIIWCVVWVGGFLLMPDKMDWRAGLVAAGVLLFHFTLGWRFWRAIFVRTGILTPADDRLRNIVANTSARMKVSLPGLWRLESPKANAMALPLTRELIFTTGLMTVCTDDEVASICAHELAHLTEPKRVRVLRIVGSLVWFPVLFARPVIHSYGGIGAVLVALISVVLVPLPRMVGQRMEKRSDLMAAEQQSEEGVYARALEKLYRQNQMPAVIGSTSKIHPDLYDRMLAAGIQPDFERPQRPEVLVWFHFLVWFIFGPVIGVLLARSGF